MGGSREWRQERVAAGNCVECGKPRAEGYDAARVAMLRGRAPYALPHAPTATRCSVCAGKHQAAVESYRRRDRIENSFWGAGGNGDPLPFGGAAPRIDAVANVRARLDRPTIDALAVLKARYAEQSRRAGQKPLPFQLSRLVREAIRKWEHRSGGYRSVGAWACVRGVGLNVQLDAPTLAVLDREAAAHFDGSRAAALRAIIVATANPPVQPTTAGRRISAAQDGF